MAYQAIAIIVKTLLGSIGLDGQGVSTLFFIALVLLERSNCSQQRMLLQVSNFLSDFDG